MYLIGLGKDSFTLTFRCIKGNLILNKPITRTTIVRVTIVTSKIMGAKVCRQSQHFRRLLYLTVVVSMPQKKHKTHENQLLM
jgi:hypothetical protein